MNDTSTRRSMAATLARGRLVRACSRLTLVATTWLAACVGNIGDPPTDQSRQPSPIITNRFPRLSHAQWEGTVQDLFGLDSPTGLSSAFVPDPHGETAFDDDESVLLVGPALSLDYQLAAETVGALVTSDNAHLARFMPYDLSLEPTARARQFLERFGRRAYRRPLLPEQVDQLLALFAHGAVLYPDLDPFVAGVRVTVGAMLQSPFFIYRAELETSRTDGHPASIDDWAIASRLSYAVWNSMPDDELFRAAGAGELATPKARRAQIERMLDTPRAQATVKSFFDQLYGGERYGSLTKDSTLYPGFSAEVGAEMRSELGKFVEYVYSEGGGLSELLTSRTTFVTPRLASIYGLSADALATPDADGFSRTELDPSERSGLLTLSGFLAWKAGDSQPKTIQRGVFLARQIICQNLGDPPPAAQGAMVAAVDLPTDRERVDKLTGPGTCGEGCRGEYMNPLGFAFEHYGAEGEYRAEDAGHPIDSSGAYSFDEGSRSYGDATELSEALAQSRQVHACFTGHLLEYLLGRRSTPSDERLSAQLAQSSLSGTSTRELLVSVLESDVLTKPQIVENL